MKNPKWEMLEEAMAVVSFRQYKKGITDAVNWMERNGFIRKKQAAFLMDYFEDPGILELNGEGNLWFAQMVDKAAKTLGIAEELDDNGDHD